MYSLLFAMLCLSGYALVRALRAPGPGGGPGRSTRCATLLTVHTHYYAAFAVVAHGLFVLCRARALRGLGGRAAGGGGGFLPWVYQHYRLLAGQAVDQVQDFSLANLGRILRQGALGFTVGATFPAGYAPGWAGCRSRWPWRCWWLAAARPATRWAGALLACGCWCRRCWCGSSTSGSSTSASALSA